MKVKHYVYLPLNYTDFLERGNPFFWEKSQTAFLPSLYPLSIFSNLIDLRSERKAGEILKETELSKGGEWTHKEHQSSESTGAIPKLKDKGITRDQSSNWQRIAKILYYVE